MQQSDILSLAISGVQRELEEAKVEVKRLTDVLTELTALDRVSAPADDNATGRPTGFLPRTEWGQYNKLLN